MQKHTKLFGKIERKIAVREFRIKGSTEKVEANCLKNAVIKLVCDWDEVKYYTRHWYTRSFRKSWCEVVTTYGYECIVEEC